MLNIVPYEEATLNENGEWNDETVVIDEVSIEYLQNTDCSGNDGNEEVQALKITARNNGVERFLNIKTDSWSIDGVDELKAIIEDFKHRSGIYTEKEEKNDKFN